MTRELILTNARIVTADAVFLGTLASRDGRITDIAASRSSVGSALDCEGDYLLPGLVELHTDALERHVVPRPKVRWQTASAVLAHDAQMASAGITTVYDALACGDVIDGSDRLANLEAMANAVSVAQAQGRLRAEHRLHLRCEVSTPALLDLFNTLAVNPLVGLVSLMDHTPGQRQFACTEKHRTYYMGKYGLSATEMDELAARQQRNSARYSTQHRTVIAGICRERGLTLASHDDAKPEHIAEAKLLGVAVAEFPTTLAAAEAAREAGMKVLMGAPNLILGGSHSGNVSARELADEGTLDMLSSDYVPVSLLGAAFLLHKGATELPLPQAIAMVAGAPARVAGLTDRGVIETGRRADLVRAHDAGEVPVVRMVWREGRRVA